MKYLCIDWGLKRVGVAVSEGEIAAPLKTLEISGLKDGINKIQLLVDEEGAEKLIIGQPEGEMGKAVGRVVKELGKRGLQVEKVDETLSSHKAMGAMIEAGKSQSQRRDDNAVAAAIILQEFLDERKR